MWIPIGANTVQRLKINQLFHIFPFKTGRGRIRYLLLLTVQTLVTLQSLKVLEDTASNIFALHGFLAVPHLPPHGHVLKSADKFSAN
jgi:hypothetical protein